MSILIKGMDMPKDGTYTARIHVKDGVAILDNPTGAGYFELLPIQTPHGKLIDVEEVDRSLSAHVTLSNDPKEDWKHIYEAIESVQTIIESED